ncbi:MAG: hypothetical protein AAGE52_10495 [Myxococcota bacterium]
MKRLNRCILEAALLLGALLFGTSGARAHSCEGTEECIDLLELELLIGAKFSYAWARETVGEHGAGAGLFVELPLIPGHLDVELSGQVLRFHGDAWEVPVDLLVKGSTSVGEALRLYVGIGPAIAVRVEHDERTTLVGAVFACGAYLWVTTRFGLDLELNYGLFGRAQHPVHDVTVSIGPVVRFFDS